MVVRLDFVVTSSWNQHFLNSSTIIFNKLDSAFLVED